MTQDPIREALREIARLTRTWRALPEATCSPEDLLLKQIAGVAFGALEKNPK